MNWLQDYGPILLGLALGSLAHFGRLLSGGEVPTVQHVIGFLMQLGLIGVVASVATRSINVVDPDVRALCAALLAVSAQEVIQYLKRNGWRQVVNAKDRE